MTIERELKHILFSWDDQIKLLLIKKSETAVFLSRPEMFSLARFILRIAQKGKRRKQ